MSKEISITEVKKHKTRKSAWIIIHNEVYDVTPYLSEHPGGEDALLDVAGQDGTQAFEDVGHSEDARQIMKKFKIGKLPQAEHSKTVAPCSAKCPNCSPDSCPVGKGKKSKKDKSPRTYDGSSSYSYQGLSRKSPKEPVSPRVERRVHSIVVPRERARRRVCPPSPPPQSSNLKWALIALAGALIIGIALKKYMG